MVLLKYIISFKLLASFLVKFVVAFGGGLVNKTESLGLSVFSTVGSWSIYFLLEVAFHRVRNDNSNSFLPFFGLGFILNILCEFYLH